MNENEQVEKAIKVLEDAGFTVNKEARAPLSCILGFHNWNGGKKCTVCGATRGK